jgi:predicted DsbA family dithiol-disulfide isomerase
VPIICALVDRVSIGISEGRFAHLALILGNSVPPVEVRYLTDPACSWSWGGEPQLRKLMWEFDGRLEFVWVMGGLARNYGPDYSDRQGGIGSGADRFAELAMHWLEVAAETRMPFDPRIWSQNPIRSTYPACMAVKAAAEQGSDAAYRYMRRLREGLMAERKRLDHADALAAEAGPAGLDPERFRVDLESNAITELFAADLDEVRDVPQEAREQDQVGETERKERVSFPSAVFIGPDGGRHGVWGPQPYEAYREAALAAGATAVNEGPLEPMDAVQRFGRLATVEAEALSGRPRPPVEAELWRLATEWKLKPVPAPTGTLWEKA